MRYLLNDLDNLYNLEPLPMLNYFSVLWRVRDSGFNCAWAENKAIIFNSPASTVRFHEFFSVNKLDALETYMYGQAQSYITITTFNARCWDWIAHKLKLFSVDLYKLSWLKNCNSRHLHSQIILLFPISISFLLQIHLKLLFNQKLDQKQKERRWFYLVTPMGIQYQ